MHASRDPVTSASSARFAPPPSGTVTFVFTDVEDGAERWERAREAMQIAIARHDRVIRAAVAATDGRVFKTVGDGLCASFARPQDAIDAAVAAQRALAAEDFTAIDGLAVRMAIHTGTADERDGDHFGPASNRVSRLLALACGGQILVSGVTAELARAALPPDESLRDLGEHRLKDLTRPERVYQLLAPGIGSTFPPLRSVAAPNNLPSALTSFVGREREVAEIGASLAAHRFVCIVGAGGIGKTRTALAVAANALDAFADGAWFVELAPLASGDYVASSVARVLGITLPAGDPTANLARALAAKSALLVFDNCEHLAEPVARVVASILQNAPGVKILASSRQGLGVPGERTYRLPSLGVSEGGDGDGASAIALFVDRARGIDGRFELSDENVAAVADVCRRLDGIPLAIELAAARVKILTPRQLVGRLDERFRLLTGGDRGALPRQQTLRALMDWSHDLLDERERALFRRLAIFASDFTFDAALAVAASGDLDEIDAIDLLGSLVDKSLVTSEPGGDAARYRLLESTHVYAREKLDASGERDACADLLSSYLLDRFVRVRERCEETARRAELHEAFATDLDDVRASLDRAIAGGDPLRGALLFAETSGRAWASLGLTTEYRTRARALLAALPEGETGLHAVLAIAIAFVDANDGLRASAVESTAYALRCARASGEPRILAQTLLAYARHCATQLELVDEAEAAIREVEALADLPREYRVRTLHERAFLGMQRGDYDVAARAYEHLREEHRALGNVALMDLAGLSLAEVEHGRGRTREAIAIVTEMLPGLRARRDRQMVITVLANLAGYCVASNDIAGSCEAAREVVTELAERDPNAAFLAVAIDHLALAVGLGGDAPRAALLHGFAEKALRASGFERLHTENATRDRLRALLAERLAPDERARLEAAGAALEPDGAASLALRES